MSTSPLMLLLGGVLSQDHNQMEHAMQQARAIVRKHQGKNERAAPASNRLVDVTSLILDASPGLASTPSQDGSLPIHVAASLGNVPVGRVLLQKCPSALLTPNNKGKTALHNAAREGRIAMVRFLLRCDFRTARVRTKKDKLPLHFAAAEGNICVVQALLDAYPEGTSVVSTKGKLPLHLAARWGHVEVARLLLDPHTASFRDWEGSLPLHDASREGQPATAALLIQHYPQGLRVANLRGEIPLFGAVRSGNVSLVLLLLQAWPLGGKSILQNIHAEDNIEDWNPQILELCLLGAAFGTEHHHQNHLDRYGWQCPEHCLQPSTDDSASVNLEKNEVFRESGEKVQAGDPVTTPVECSKKRLLAVPAVESTRTKRRRSPRNDDCLSLVRDDCPSEFLALHAALVAGATVRVVKLLVVRYASQLTKPNRDGRWPLHLAMLHPKMTPELICVVLDEMLRPHPEAAHVRDVAGGCLALHVALTFRADFRLVRALLDPNRASGCEPCRTDDPRFATKRPIWMATAMDCDLSTVYYLLRIDPSVLKDIVQ